MTSRSLSLTRSSATLGLSHHHGAAGLSLNTILHTVFKFYPTNQTRRAKKRLFGFPSELYPHKSPIPVCRSLASPTAWCRWWMALYTWPIDHVIGSTTHSHVCPSLPFLNPLSESPYISDPIVAAAIYGTTIPNTPFLPLLPFLKIPITNDPLLSFPWHQMWWVGVQGLLWWDG